MLVSLMDHFGIVKAPTGIGDDGIRRSRLRALPRPLLPTCQVDPNEGMDAVRALDRR